MFQSTLLGDEWWDVTKYATFGIVECLEEPFPIETVWKRVTHS